MIEIRPVRTPREKHAFLTFPWQIYRKDPLWVPPLLPERRKAADPKQGLYFKGGYADFFAAFQEGRMAGTICCSHEYAGEEGECSVGFFECIDDYSVAEALFRHAESWARGHGLTTLCGTYNLDREDCRGVLVEGCDRPAALLCGHNPLYYGSFFEKFGFGRRHDDGLAYAVDLDPENDRIQRMIHLANRVRGRRDFTIRHADLKDFDAEVDRITLLQNRSMEHLPGFVAYTRESVSAMLLPLIDMADLELVLFVEDKGQAIGWFPAIPNFNEILIHLNGLRYPWDYLRALRYRNYRPKSLSIKSAAVLPEYWDTGAAILLFAEMARRAIAKGYRWVDLSLTGEENPDTWDIAHHTGAKIYKRYRFYKKELSFPLPKRSS